MRRVAGKGKRMTQLIERTEAHYEINEVPFGRSYQWHQAYISLLCDCGDTLPVSCISTITTCRCGAELGVFIHDIQEGEDHLPDEVTHPWRYDDRERAEQHLRDEAAYPKGSPWRYNDITVSGEE